MIRDEPQRRKESRVARFRDAHRFGATILVLAHVGLTGCTWEAPPSDESCIDCGDRTGTLQLATQVTWDTARTTVAITGDGLVDPIVRELGPPVDESRRLSTTVNDIPVGAERIVTIEAYLKTGIPVRRGSLVIPMEAGQVTRVWLGLQRARRTLEIEASFPVDHPDIALIDRVELLDWSDGEYPYPFRFLELKLDAPRSRAYGVLDRLFTGAEHSLDIRAYGVDGTVLFEGTEAAPMAPGDGRVDIALSDACRVNNGGCHAEGSCSIDAGKVQCYCQEGHQGDGWHCEPWQ